MNSTAPTADVDEQIAAILTEAAETATESSGISIELRQVMIESPGQAEGTILSLINDGVSVIITGCDDATIPAVVQAATANELLALTGCVSLPRPDIGRLAAEIDSELFIDLSNLADNATAIANHAASSDFASVGVIRSNLFPDVERTCIDLQNEVANPSNDALAQTDTGQVPPGTVRVGAEIIFTELVDAPGDVATDLLGSLGEADLDAVVICALPPTVGDVVSALRESGFDQPVIVPWYGDAQVWESDTTNVFVITPASRYGDDPQTATASLFDALVADGRDPNAVDVVTADALSVLTHAAASGGSVGSRSLADTIQSGDAFERGEGVSGLLGPGNEEIPVRRVYRVIEINDGEATFVAEASALAAE